MNQLPLGLYSKPNFPLKQQISSFRLAIVSVEEEKSDGRRRRSRTPRSRWRRFQSQSVDDDRWAQLSPQALEAQHCLRHGRHLPHLYPHRHEICRARGYQFLPLSIIYI